MPATGYPFVGAIIGRASHEALLQEESCPTVTIATSQLSLKACGVEAPV
jgi:hypothetical protein